MKVQGWIDDTTAVRLAFKFAGEAIGEDEIEKMLDQAPAPIVDRDRQEERDGAKEDLGVVVGGSVGGNGDKAENIEAAIALALEEVTDQWTP
jgi:hypothetical protein